MYLLSLSLSLSLSEGDANDSFDSNNHPQFSTVDKDDPECPKRLALGGFQKI